MFCCVFLSFCHVFAMFCCIFAMFCCIFAMFCCVFVMFCCVFAMFYCVFVIFCCVFVMFCCILVVKISLFLCFRFGFIVDNNFSVLIPLFCAVKLIISLDYSIVKFKLLKSIDSIYISRRQNARKK